MNATAIVADFNMSQSDLVKVGFEKQLFMVRDAKELASRGIPGKRITDFKTMIEAFVNLPTDGELDVAKQEATEAKTLAQTQAITQMQVVMGIVGTVTKPSTKGYKMFGTAGLDTASEAALYMGLKRAVRVGRARLATYAERGLTADMLTELEKRNEDFQEKLDLQQDAESDRGDAADERITEANKVYAELMELCAVGKAYFAHEDQRKHDDYVVNDTPPAAAVPVPPVG